MLEINNKDQFEKEVLESEKPVLVEFHAHWCGPSKAMESVLADVDKKYSNELMVIKVSVGEGEGEFITYDYRIKAYPTLLLMKEGRTMERIIGLVDFNEITGLLKKNNILE
ncbi:MAG: thioredoxin family protein [Candidatus Eremiobacteraeota bacterium]|nr:thioredoxin family protein [Candidatus Eremiobacteraeota bacterium]